MSRGAVGDEQEVDPIQSEYADSDETLSKSLFLVSTLIYDSSLVINISRFSRGRRRSDGSIQYFGRILRHALPVASTKYHEMNTYLVDFPFGIILYSRLYSGKPWLLVYLFIISPSTVGCMYQTPPHCSLRRLVP
jgi:hypothetical protein